MGYRSEVAYQIAFYDKPTLNEFIARVMMLGGDEVTALKECQIDIPDNGSEVCFINYHAEDVKWYERFPEVQGHDRLHKLAIEWMPDKSGYRFIRIGEDVGDVVEESDGELEDCCYYLQIIRGLDLNFSHDYEPVGDNLAIIP